MKRNIELVVVNTSCEIKKFKDRQSMNKIKRKTVVGFVLLMTIFFCL